MANLSINIYSYVWLVAIEWDIHIYWLRLNVPLSGFHPYKGSHIKQSSKQTIKQKDRFHHCCHMVGPTEACPSNM